VKVTSSSLREIAVIPGKSPAPARTLAAWTSAFNCLRDIANNHEADEKMQ
jgi:hypothetical protein